MRYFLLVLALLSTLQPLSAQQGCRTVDYKQTAIARDPGLSQRLSEIERFTRLRLKTPSVAVTGEGGATSGTSSGTSGAGPIIIPVIVHVIYNSSAQNISDEQISSQMDVLNRDYGKLNPDTAKIPSYYRSLAADCGFRFELAAVDTNGNHISGIVRKHTAVQSFTYDDAIKFAAKGGDNAWDRDRYLNIWVGPLVAGTLGYSSVLGCAKEVDGVVVNYTSFGTMGTASAPFNLGRTTTHEIGHWLNLIHVWGDANCGDDEVADTPPQQAATYGDPSGMIFSCGNTPFGNLYMDYMDFTDDVGMHLFTYGQRDRMKILFAPGGFRAPLLNTAALVQGTTTQAPSPEGSFSGQNIRISPNPAVGLVNIVSDGALKSGELEIYNLVGQKVVSTSFNGLSLSLDVSSLPKGLYFVKLSGKNNVSRLLKM